MLGNPAAIENPFFLMFPSWALWPVVLLTTVATVIASQAVITGAYSITRQAIQLGLLPRFGIRHTSEEMAGQIYLPRVNWLLLIAVLLLVVIFKSSSALAAAYGVAVTATMITTSLMAFFVFWKLWQWPMWRVAALIVPLLLIEQVFFAANVIKIFEGAWVPLAIAIALMLVMLTWVRGTAILSAVARKQDATLDWLVNTLEKKPPHRVNGTAVFLTGNPHAAPSALLHNLKHNHMLHERNIVLTIKTADVPRVPNNERVKIERLSDTFTAVISHLRVHGDAERLEGAAAVSQARPQRGPRGHLVLPVAPRAATDLSLADAALAGEALHLARRQRRGCHHLLPDPIRSRGRDRHPDRRLSSARVRAADATWRRCSTDGHAETTD